MKRYMINTIGITIALILITANAMAGCTVYKGKKYVGASKDIAAGQEISSFEKNWDNQISSVKVSPGCQLTVWKDVDFQGKSKELTGNVKDVGRMDNIISSAKCVCQQED